MLFTSRRMWHRIFLRSVWWESAFYSIRSWWFWTACIFLSWIRRFLQEAMWRHVCWHWFMDCCLWRWGLSTHLPSISALRPSGWLSWLRVHPLPTIWSLLWWSRLSLQVCILQKDCRFMPLYLQWVGLRSVLMWAIILGYVMQTWHCWRRHHWIICRRMVCFCSTK